MDVQVVAGASEAAPQAALPAAGSQPSSAPTQQTAHADAGALSPVLARLFGEGSSAQISVNVSYRVEHDPNMIVTVFTDPQTGREISQIPAEAMVQIAQFFDKQTGVTLDESA